jgi:hypothetical protein
MLVVGKFQKMTHIISTITPESILMASDSRLNFHNTEKDVKTGEIYQVITATADCIRKTFFLNKIKIGIQFIGIGYFQRGNDKYPLNDFMDFIQQDVSDNENIQARFHKVFKNLKRLTEAGNIGQYVNGVMTGYQDNIPFICTFYTYSDEMDINSYEVGTYVESKPNSEKRPATKTEAVEYINRRISTLSTLSPQDNGGPIEILEIKPNGETYWLQQNNRLFQGPLSELIGLWQNNPDKINGKVLETPIRQKMNV